MRNTKNVGPASPDRRDFLVLGLSAAALAAVPSASFVALSSEQSSSITPIAGSALLSSKPLKNAALRVFEHYLSTTSQHLTAGVVQH